VEGEICNTVSTVLNRTEENVVKSKNKFTKIVDVS